VRFLAGLFAVLSLTACTTMQDVEMARLHYSAHQAAQQPLFRLTAQPGEQVVLSGVAELVVAAPSAPVQYQQQHHPVWGLIGQVLPLAAQGVGTVALVKAVGAVARDVTVVEQPAPVVVTQPPSTVITQPPPLVVPAPTPVIVEQPPPIIVGGRSGGS
jgi:hypothetical protein